MTAASCFAAGDPGLLFTTVSSKLHRALIVLRRLRQRVEHREPDPVEVGALAREELRDRVLLAPDLVRVHRAVALQVRRARSRAAARRSAPSRFRRTSAPSGVRAPAGGGATTGGGRGLGCGAPAHGSMRRGLDHGRGRRRRRGRRGDDDGRDALDRRGWRRRRRRATRERRDGRRERESGARAHCAARVLSQRSRRPPATSRARARRRGGRPRRHRSPPAAARAGSGRRARRSARSRTSMRPPCASAYSRAIASPSPEPLTRPSTGAAPW